MGLGGGPPLSLNQDFGIQDMWSPATPVKNIPTRSPIIPKPSHGLPNQSSGPSWLDMVTGVQATTPWGLAFQNDACSSLALSTRLQDLNGSPEVAEVSTSQAAIGCAVPRPSITNRHNADALNHWSPKLGATALNAGNNNMPPLAPCFMQNGNFQVMPESSNQHLLNGKVLLPHGWCNDSSINWSISMTQYGSAGTFLPNLNSFPEAAMRFSGTENYSQRMQDKNQYLELAREGSFLVNELHAEASFSNLVASSDYSSIQNPGCAKDLAVRSDEASYQELEIEKSLAERENEGLELNDTSKQKPRRKKHRPKVIIEGKSVRTPKPGTPKPKTPKLAQDKENALVKRKYTHKKKDTSFSETNELGEIVESKSMSEVKSVRRGLNFDLEDSQTTDKFSVLMSMFMNNIENDEQEACKDGNLMSSRLKETADSTEVHGPVRENTLEGTVFDLKRTIIGPQNDYLKIIQTPLWSDTVSQNVETSKNNVSSNCVSDVPRGKKRDQHLTCEALELEKEYLMHSYNAGNCANKSHDLNRRGACLPYNNKKMRKETGPSEASMHTPSKFTYTPTGWETVQASNYTQDFTFTDSMKFISQDKLHTLESRLLCEEADVNKHSYQTLSNMSSLPGLIDYNRSPVPIKPSWPRNNNISQPPTPDKPSEYSNSQESKICGTLLKFDTSEDVNKPMKAKVKRGRKRKEENLLVNSLHSTSSNGASARNGEYLHHEIISFNCQDTKNRKASINSTFPLSPHMDFVDYLVRKLRQLNLNSGYEVASSQAQNAIVPYVSNGGMMVPFEGPFELAKRRRLRAKVDLDPETNRVWKLLMGIEGGDVGEKVDKEKWWEEERLVFRGRVDSFIARMHLVQGDRRFSQWKGSVVDSVIGVFLTQNVSDHLSSSAYMSLAAKFPLRPGRVYVAPNTEEAKIPLEEHNKPITTFIDTPYSKQNILDDISYSQGCSDLNATKNEGKKEVSSSSETPRSGSGCSNIACCTGIIETHEAELNFGHESPNSGSITGVTVTRSISSVEIEDRRLAEEVVSSQTSVISSQSSTGHQVPSNDYIRPSLLLNLETDDLLGGRTNNSFGCSSFTELLHIAESSKFQELYSHGSMSSTNGIHKIENGFPVLDQIDNVNPHHTPYGLSDILPESRFFYSLSPNFTILESNAGAVPEEIRSSLDCNKFEVNNGECSESAAENLVASDGLNKLLLTPGSTSTIDSYSPITTQHKASSTFSETEVCIDHQSFAHKNFGEKTQHKESSTFSETEVCIDHQSFTHTNFGEKTAASSNIEIWKDCIQAEDMKRLQQKNELSPFKAETSQDATKVPSQMEKSPKNSSVSNRKVQNKLDMDQKVGSNAKDGVNNFHKVLTDTPKQVEKAKKKADNEKIKFDWDSLRKEVNQNKPTRERSSGTMDSIDWEAVRCADVSEISETIRERGMNNMLAERIKDFLNRLVREHGSIDLEWLRDVPPDKSKDYLLSIRGLGLKSAECVRLLTLHHLAFPVDTNVGRICVRLGWVPLQPLPESLQLHLLELYPVLETIQKYLWPRLCKLDQRTLYELHYQMITFGKVFCTKSKPNCNACPMRGECRHFASAFASARLALPPPEDKSIVSSAYPIASECEVAPALTSSSIPKLECSTVSHDLTIQNCEPIIEEPATPEPECHESLESAIEDAFFQDLDEIPTIKLNFEKFTQNLQNYMQENMELQEGDMSKALVALTPEAASIPMPKLKNISRLRTEHQVYEIPDSHRLLEGLDRREPDDPCPYLLAIWTPGETAQSIEPPKDCCNSHDTGQLCDRSTCFTCNSTRESQAHTVRGTLLIPCRTAMRGSFPLNGTYFQVNEVFADHHSSRNPIDIPRDWIWNLPRRTVCFGTSIPTIFRGLTTEGIQQCFWRGFVCVRGFDRVTRAPKPLYARLHFPASKAPKIRKGGVTQASATTAKEDE